MSAVLAPGQVVGVVEDVRYTQGGAGNQITTISGVEYVTFWDINSRDWKVGDTVTFRAFRAKLWANSLTPVLQAGRIAKVTP
jgi:hypothetical protein